MNIYDPYGSLSAAVAGMELQNNISRGSGRTELMLISALETGGTIICDMGAYDHIRNMVRSMRPMGKRNTEVIPIDPSKPEDVYRKVRHGPIYFDHHWLFLCHQNSIQRASDVIYDMIRKYPSPLHVYDKMGYENGKRMNQNMIGSLYVKGPIP